MRRWGAARAGGAAVVAMALSAWLGTGAGVRARENAEPEQSFLGGGLRDFLKRNTELSVDIGPKNIAEGSLKITPERQFKSFSGRHAEGAWKDAPLMAELTVVVESLRPFLKAK